MIGTGRRRGAGRVPTWAACNRSRIQSPFALRLSTRNEGGVAPELERARLMWWLTYWKFTKTQVVILKTSSLIQAREIVSMSGLDDGMTFQEGHELDAVRAKLVPAEYIAKMLGRRETEALLRKMDGQKNPGQRGGDRGKVCVE